MNIVPFDPAHLVDLECQPEQETETQFMRPEEMAELDHGRAFSAIENGIVFGSAGIMDWAGWDGQRAFAWAILRSNIGISRLLTITRFARRQVAEHPARRVECAVRTGFANGHIWANRLGFDWEGVMRGYGFDGSDYHLYARVKR